MGVLDTLCGRGQAMWGAVIGAGFGTAFAVEALAAARAERGLIADAARDRDLLRAAHEAQLETLRQANATQVLVCKEMAEAKLLICDQGARTRELMALLRPTVVQS